MKEYLPQIIASAIVIVLLPVFRFLLSKLVFRSGRMIHMPVTRIRQIRQVVNVIINLVFIFSLAIIWGVEPGNILLGLSSVFAVIGVAFFAQWSILSNITAGIIMFFSAPYKVGDRIHIIDKDIPLIATIVNIQTFYTHIRTDKEELIVIPNSLFLQKVVSVLNQEE